MGNRGQSWEAAKIYQTLHQTVHMDAHIPLERDACALPVLPLTSNTIPNRSIRTRIMGLEVLQHGGRTCTSGDMAPNIKNGARDCVRTCHPQGLIGRVASVRRRFPNEANGYAMAK